MNSRKRPSIFGLALCIASFSVDLVALDSDRDQPIQIEADIAVRDESAGETRYEGNVILTQGSLRITADRISIKHDSAAADKIVAIGQPATLVQQPASDQGSCSLRAA